MARCEGHNHIILLEPTPVAPVACVNGRPPVKVSREDEPCDYHYECECKCACGQRMDTLPMPCMSRPPHLGLTEVSVHRCGQPPTLRAQASQLVTTVSSITTHPLVLLCLPRPLSLDSDPCPRVPAQCAGQ